MNVSPSWITSLTEYSILLKPLPHLPSLGSLFLPDTTIWSASHRNGPMRIEPKNCASCVRRKLFFFSVLFPPFQWSMLQLVASRAACPYGSWPVSNSNSTPVICREAKPAWNTLRHSSRSTALIYSFAELGPLAQVIWSVVGYRQYCAT